MSGVVAWKRVAVSGMMSWKRGCVRHDVLEERLCQAWWPGREVVSGMVAWKGEAMSGMVAWKGGAVELAPYPQAIATTIVAMLHIQIGNHRT